MKYKVSLQAVHPLIQTVIIEANSEFEADEIALQMAKNDEVEWIYCDWNLFVILKSSLLKIILVTRKQKITMKGNL